MYYTPEERIEAVKAFATAHYDKDGWDIVVETYSDEDIQRAYGLARTPEGAIANVAKQVGALAIYRDDIIASGDDIEVDFTSIELSKSQQVLETLGKKEYDKAYNKGWKHSQTVNASLDNQPAGDVGWAWEDGYMDYAGDRGKFHRRDCPLGDHNECGTV